MLNGVEQEYEYKPKWTVIVFCAIFFGLCAVGFGARAASNTRGVIINRIIGLGPEGATIFYWILCSFSVGFVAIAVFLSYS